MLQLCSDTYPSSIVAVHGLGSNSKRGWTTNGVCWLSEFLHRDLDREGHRHRIMLFSHDSRWGPRSSEMSFDAFAEDLLDELGETRQTPEERQRRIVFIAHSFGGLIVKKALIKAALKTLQQPGSSYASIYNCTTGVLFLGVPHAGCNPAFLFAARFLSYILAIWI
ncbi:hypothetical protein K440DRAFT_38681 [Wilcoxina mikolae CBS 423.85]|nr:hypothetical protein K440DRAFT_38681 [Wilcoxina mikolae CBS 423.85]